jgi:hypothetical protein
MDVWLDVDQDGEDDYLVRGVDLGVVQGLAYTGQYVSAFYDLGAGTASILFFAEVDFNDRVMALIFNHGGAVSGEVDFFAELWNLRSGDTMAMTDGTFDMRRGDRCGLCGSRGRGHVQWRRPRSLGGTRDSLAVSEQPALNASPGDHPGDTVM